VLPGSGSGICCHCIGDSMPALGSKLTGPVMVNARQINPRQLPGICSAANGECVPGLEVTTIYFRPFGRIATLRAACVATYLMIRHPPGAQRPTEIACAWILPSTGPNPNRAAISLAAALVASSRRPGSRASISLRSGVPWQYPIAGSRCDAARLRLATVSICTRANPVLLSSLRIVPMS
jgi:hypothetical protein